MDVTLPQKQAHGSSSPLLVPLYQIVRLTQIENIPTIKPTGLSATKSVTGYGCFCDDVTNTAATQIWSSTNPVDFATGDVAIDNINLHAVYNQDASCNDNTCNYCLKHAINLNDFHCITYTQAYSGSADRMNYQFTLNSSLGPYVKYIIYYAYYQDKDVPVH